LTDLELELLSQIRVIGLPEPEVEYLFHPVRKWRFDMCWKNIMLAVEVEGGTWTGGRHTNPAGFEKDCQKYNNAALLGWRVMRFTSGMVRSGEAVKMIEEAL